MYTPVQPVLNHFEKGSPLSTSKGAVSSSDPFGQEPVKRFVYLILFVSSQGQMALERPVFFGDSQGDQGLLNGPVKPPEDFGLPPRPNQITRGLNRFGKAPNPFQGQMKPGVIG